MLVPRIPHLHVYCALSWITLSFAITAIRGSQHGIPLGVVKLWASAFGGEIKSIATKYSGSQLLQKKYKEYEKTVRLEEIDGARLVKNVAENMAEMFRKKAEAAHRIVEVAEEAHLQHEENPDLQYEYFNAVLINEVDGDGRSVELGGEFILEPNDHFSNLSVNLSLSVVQVPTNMYNKDPDIVNGVYWSEALNKIFVENYEKDPSLIWQYFGSAKGFFRQYPGVKWHPDEHGVISFDCRNRKWYIQAATSPKDVVILVDVSGSMKGLRLTIARQTVSSILDTLGDDDFFNIIAYNQEVHYVEPCLNGTLVQADRTNKDFKLARRGSVCSRAIMLVTDGATEMYDDVFAKFNWPERKVRIFPYLIGRESAFADNLKWMACANKGYFSQISTLADVQENVMRYLHVMSRPKVIDHEHDTVWTEAYVDSALAQAHKLGAHRGPNPMTTVAMPVFSTKNETKNQGILLGVVGIDIPIQELMKTVPKHKLGIHGYAFAITNNGYILMHPDLRPLYQEGQKRRKAHYSSVDLSEVEWEDSDDFLRTAMVNRKTGTFSMEVKRTVDKRKRVLSMHNDYYFTDIKGTPFSIGVALSRGHGKYFLKGNVSLDAGLRDLDQPDVALADEWTYCNTDDHHEHQFLTQVQAIKQYLTSRKPQFKCDRELIQQVLFDAVVSAPLKAYWTGLALNKSENPEKGVEIAFLGTRTGLSRTNLFVVTEQLTNQDLLTAEDKEGVFNADHFPLWYKRAAEQVPGTFVYSIPFSSGSSAQENKSVVLASTAVQLLEDRRSSTVAAIGIQMKLDFFQRKFWTASRQCNALDGKCPISCDNEDIKCYLIDNNGFILVSEDYSQTGLFFGEVEGAVMNKLLLMGSFKRITLYDYQALCKEYTGSSDSGHTLLNPFSAIRWLMAELVLFMLEFNLYSWWNVDSAVKAERAQRRTMMVPCDTEYPAFVSERTIKETAGSIDCEGCMRTFVIQQIPSSNLFMVVVENKCDCSSTGPVTMEPIEIIYIESLKCERLKFQKDRKRPDSCHPFHPEENAVECGSAVTISPLLGAALFPLLAFFISRTEYI
ncbi:voltage-dependent calcium channel subunit alpha-2/delta-3 isoform X3 [Brachyhypopomus gauderio]|uniref:voltage-dependent calcium channel subunit alpha-2/delta-3 isoform X3 n=1 Tax=Brachyhypopomus gauderio TaxID=698409 RepID=UPI0040427088